MDSSTAYTCSVLTYKMRAHIGRRSPHQLSLDQSSTACFNQMTYGQGSVYLVGRFPSLEVRRLQSFQISFLPEPPIDLAR